MENSKKTKKLVAYITAGFPEQNFSVDLALALKNSGADIIELGIPFSDPVADGPVIEEANLRALRNGFKMDSLFDISKEITDKIDTYWMGYFNSFYSKGVENISSLASELGVKGFIIPDLPYEETLQYKQTFKRNDISLVSFVAPTDGDERIQTVVKDSNGFIYLVAYAGITGSGASEDLTQIIKQIKEKSKTPLYIGFGVNEKTAKQKSCGVDGVIVGSAFIKVLLDNTISHTTKIKRISKIAKNIKEAING